jgi:signal transduction histidine kinase
MSERPDQPTSGPALRDEPRTGLLRGARTPSPSASRWQRFCRAVSIRSAARIRSKLIALHTLFSLLLAVVLLSTLRAPITRLIAESEMREAALALALLNSGGMNPDTLDLQGIHYAEGDAARLGLSDELAESARAAAGRSVSAVLGQDDRPSAVRYDPQRGVYQVMASRSPKARAAVSQLYLLLTISLLGVYGAIALALELFVLPKQVYGPIDRIRQADDAVQRGDRENEVIPEQDIPADELGQLMRSRNASISKLRTQERELNEALEQIETIANELKRKNHLLEAARRNLADQDRLASLGIMSAGIAHELNTPLAVLKGTLEQFAEDPSKIEPGRVQLMLRVARRLEGLGESLLDFARIRPRSAEPVDLQKVISEAWTLVSLDRDAKQIRFTMRLGESATCIGDADRLLQVFVNLLRNGVQAIDGEPGSIIVESSATMREGRRWLSVVVRDTGPGIDPLVLPRLFEPFSSTRLDDKGTGLGLAVSEGIIAEHGGVLLARNATPPERGAVFEIMLPADRDGKAPGEDAPATAVAG